MVLFAVLSGVLCARVRFDVRIYIPCGICLQCSGCSVCFRVAVSCVCGHAFVLQPFHQLDGFFRIHLEKDPGANTELRCPAQLPADVMERVRAAGTAVYEALGCEGLARVDLFVTPEGEVVFNEVNSMPGLTYSSRFPQMMRVAGHALGDVLASLIDDRLACC